MFGSPSLHEKFFSRLVADPQGCILWTGLLTHNGYGRLMIEQGVNKRAHHISWFIRYGYWPEYLRHTCDVRNCVKLSHLVEATEQDNINDMVAKDRQAKGEDIASAKLTDEEVLEIRRICVEERLTYQEIGARFGVSRGTIQDIHHRLYWRHLPGELGKKLRCVPERFARRFDIDGEMLTAREIADRAGVTEVAINIRIRAGLTGWRLAAGRYVGPRKPYTKSGRPRK